MPHRETRERGHVMDVQLATQIGSMRFHRFRRHAEVIRDFLRRFPSRDELQHHALAFRQQADGALHRGIGRFGSDLRVVATARRYRAQRLAEMSFLEIIGDLSPEALLPVQNVTGTKPAAPPSEAT